MARQLRRERVRRWAQVKRPKKSKLKDERCDQRVWTQKVEKYRQTANKLIQCGSEGLNGTDLKHFFFLKPMKREAGAGQWWCANPGTWVRLNPGTQEREAGESLCVPCQSGLQS